ncbi:Protein argonaute, partial [Lachnellula willkommii]
MVEVAHKRPGQSKDEIMNSGILELGLKSSGQFYKINSKLKGVSHQLVPFTTTSHPSGAAENTMVVGADVTHSTSENCPSMAAIVATNDDVSNQYLGSARLQNGEQEYISDLEGMMKERILAWYARSSNNPANKSKTPLQKLPANILFYRDGVSESQYGMVGHEELPQITRGCEQAWKEVKAEAKKNKIAIGANVHWKPKLTLIVVTKRHHARFYPINDVEAGSKQDINLPSGTIVDKTVVAPDRFDFYLQSHESPLGTARSSHYVVVHDDRKYTLSELENITNKLCYTGSRATKALSVSTPARYADILCDRLRCYMKPALDGIYAPPPAAAGTAAALSNQANINSYSSDGKIWNRQNTSQNPWHPDLNDTMFYL